MSVTTHPRPRVARAYESLTVSSTAVGFTAANYNPTAGNLPDSKQAEEVFLRVESNQVRYRLDGTDPTSAVGTILDVGETLTIRGITDISRFRAIATGSDATLRVEFRK